MTVLPVTSALFDAPLIRVTLEPNAENGLAKKSQAMIDKAVTVSREKIASAIGNLDYVSMQEIDRSLAVFWGIAK